MLKNFNITKVEIKGSPGKVRIPDISISDLKYTERQSQLTVRRIHLDLLCSDNVPEDNFPWHLTWTGNCTLLRPKRMEILQASINKLTEVQHFITKTVNIFYWEIRMPFSRRHTSRLPIENQTLLFVLPSKQFFISYIISNK